MTPPRPGWAVLLLALLTAGAAAQKPSVVSIPGGEYRPLYTVGATVARVRPFRLSSTAVTNTQYLSFVRAHPEWRRSKVKRVFAEPDYLSHWSGDLSFDAKLADSPVVHVSWFAARAYCQAQDGRLPTQDEWEFAALADETVANAGDDPGFQNRILDWYARPTPSQLPAVGSTFKNLYGLYDMHGLVWEWVEDYNTILVTGESRGDGELDRGLYCAAGVSGSRDPGDYAAYMRYAFRSSLKSTYSLGNLGFRCAWDLLERKEHR